MELRIGAREGKHLQVAGQPTLPHVHAPPHAVRVVASTGEAAVLGVLPRRPRPRLRLEAHAMDALTRFLLAKQVAHIGRRQRGRVRHPSADGGELASGSEHLRPDLVDGALAQQPRRRAVPQRRVQALEPRLHDLGGVAFSE
jgi:hypothetical protein